MSDLAANAKKYIDLLCRLTDHLPCICDYRGKCDPCLARALKTDLSTYRCQKAAEDFRRKFKQLVESGEIPISDALKQKMSGA